MKTPELKRAASGLLALVSLSLAYADPKVDEQVVGPVLADAKYVVSPEGTHLATVGRKGSRMMVTVDGVAGPRVDEVITPVLAFIDPRPFQDPAQQQPQPKPVTFSRDGTHYAYIARVSQEWVLMEDNKEVLRLPGGGAVGGTVGIGGMAGNTDLRLEFAGNDGKHLYLAKSAAGGYELWVDGQKMPGYWGSGVGSMGTADPVIFADGARFAYQAVMGTHPGDPTALIVDGKDAGYLADNLQATADGHLVGIKHDKEGDHLLLDGKSLFRARQILGVHAAPVGHRLLVVLRHTNPNGSLGEFLLVDGKPAEATLCETIKQVVFSPDGKRYAAVCGRSGAEWVVTDGKKGQEYQFIDQTAANLTHGLTFSPDSSHVVYVAHASGKSFIVTDEDESDAYDGSPFFRFMPDGKGLLTYGQQAQTWVLSMDGKVTRLPPRMFIQMDSFTWSPDRSHYAYKVGFGAQGEVYEDGKTTGLAGTFSFSPDSKHLAVVGGRAADGKSGLFVDGKLAYAMVQSIAYHAFSPDGQHLFWMSLEPVTTPNPTDAFEWVTYVDGKPVAHHDRSPAAQALLFPQGFGQFATTPPAWRVGSDGVLHILTPSPDGIKHIKATPGSDTSLALLLETASKGPDKKSVSAK